MGPCEFTTDPLRHLMIESTPSLRFENAQEIFIDLEHALSLADHYFLAVSGILDLFDPTWLTSKLPDWVANPTQRSKPSSAIIYLALAIGAQGRAGQESEEVIAEQCFAYGRQLAMFTLMDDPSLSTVQAFTLITYYMIAACRRNAAFTNLGVGVRAAYALGIHRHETNNAFVHEEGISRERAWKTLRVCDLWLSASMGRPPATSETVCNIPSAPIDSELDRESSTVAAQVASAMLRICNIFERILVEVYSKKTVTLELARSISSQHRQWTQELPQMLRIDGLGGNDEAQGFGMSPRHGSRVVAMAYYYSIVLLTRPFLTFQICHHSSKRCQPLEKSVEMADFIAYADACVDSAVKGINIAHEYVFGNHSHQRQPFVTNSVFVSLLCLGMAYLNDYDQRQWPLGRSQERGIEILSHFGTLDPQSAQYAKLCCKLKNATAKYVGNRDKSFQESNSQVVTSLFGDVRACTEPQTMLEGSGRIAHTSQHPEPIYPLDGELLHPITQSSFSDPSFQPESGIPTSGILHGELEHGHRYPAQDGSDMGAFSITSFLDGYSFEDVPLVSLTNELTPEAYFWQG
jgi:hypothetical protein